MGAEAIPVFATRPDLMVRDPRRKCLLGKNELSDPILARKLADFPLELPYRHGGLLQWQVKRTLDYIEANVAFPIEIKDLASLVSLSKSHFARCFKKRLGISPMAYVIWRRIERAKHLIETSKVLLSEIAVACGFADQSHMNRTFRNLVGMSPGLWRRTQKKPKDA